MLYADGTVVYYRYRDAVDMDDLWSPAGGEVFFDDRDNEVGSASTQKLPPPLPPSPNPARHTRYT